MRRLLLFGAGAVCITGMVLIVGIFVLAVTPREWDGDFNFRVIQLCHDKDGGPVSCATLEPDKARSAVSPFSDGAPLSTEAWNLPDMTKIGDVLTCHVHQRDLLTTGAGAIVDVDQCRHPRPRAVPRP
ncbi:MAG: hypothetical protein JOZ47_12955 [Kutzneria sp.]|nr:hypothetical protein [Kutzneria sp.]